MPSTARARQRSVADLLEGEEDWDPNEWDWEPSLCQARKKRCYGSNDSQGVPLEAAGPSAPATETTDATVVVSQTEPSLGNPKFANLPVYNTIKKIETRPENVCVVEGCGASLAGLKRYFTRLRICEVHLGAPAIVVDGVISRFCQQCGRFQPLREFTGKKKSCTERLEKVNARHREKAQLKQQRKPDARLPPQWPQGPLPEWQDVSTRDGSVPAGSVPSPGHELQLCPPPTAVLGPAPDVSMPAVNGLIGQPRIPVGVPAGGVMDRPVAAVSATSPSVASPDPRPLPSTSHLAAAGAAPEPAAAPATIKTEQPVSGSPTGPSLGLPAAGPAALPTAAAAATPQEEVGPGSGPSTATSMQPFAPAPASACAGNSAPPDLMAPTRIVNTGGAGVVWYCLKRPRSDPQPAGAVAAAEAVQQASANGGTAMAAGAAAERATTSDAVRLPRNMFWNMVTTAVVCGDEAPGRRGSDDGSGATGATAAAAPPEDVSRALAAARSELFHPVRVNLASQDLFHARLARQVASAKEPAQPLQPPFAEAAPPPAPAAAAADTCGGAATVPMDSNSAASSPEFQYPYPIVGTAGGLNESGSVGAAAATASAAQSVAATSGASPASPASLSYNDALAASGGAGSAAAATASAGDTQATSRSPAVPALRPDGFAGQVTKVISGLRPLLEQVQCLGTASNGLSGSDSGASSGVAPLAAVSTSSTVLTAAASPVSGQRDLPAIAASASDVLRRVNELDSVFRDLPQQPTAQPPQPQGQPLQHRQHRQQMEPVQGQPQPQPILMGPSPFAARQGPYQLAVPAPPVQAQLEDMRPGPPPHQPHQYGPHRSFGPTPYGGLHASVTESLPGASRSTPAAISSSSGLVAGADGHGPSPMAPAPYIGPHDHPSPAQAAPPQQSGHAPYGPYDTYGQPSSQPMGQESQPHSHGRLQSAASLGAGLSLPPPPQLPKPQYVRAMSAKSVFIRHVPPPSRAQRSGAVAAIGGPPSQHGYPYQYACKPQYPYAPLPPYPYGPSLPYGGYLPPRQSCSGPAGPHPAPPHSGHWQYSAPQPTPSAGLEGTGSVPLYAGLGPASLQLPTDGYSPFNAASGSAPAPLAAAGHWPGAMGQSPTAATPNSAAGSTGAPALGAAVQSHDAVQPMDPDSDDDACYEGVLEMLLRDMSEDLDTVLPGGALAGTGFCVPYDPLVTTQPPPYPQDLLSVMERQVQDEQQRGRAIAAAMQHGVSVHRAGMAATPYTAIASGGWPSEAAGGASGAAADAMEIDRVAIKAMNMQPQDLPGNLRSGLGRWLQGAGAEPLQATLRPGCLQLVIDVQRPAAAAAQGVDLASALIPVDDPDQASADVFRILGQRLRDTFVQVGDKVLQIRVGEDPVVTPWEEAAEDGGLAGAKMPLVEGCGTAAVCAGSETTLELRGLHLDQPSRKVFARLRGRDLPASLLADPESASSSSSSQVTTTPAQGAGWGRQLQMSVAVPPGAVGLMAVEVGVGHLLGGWWPVLVLPQSCQGAAAEVQRLVGDPWVGVRLEAAAGEAEERRREAERAASRRFVLDLGRLLDTFAAVTAASAAAAAAAAFAEPSPRSPPVPAATFLEGARRGGSASPDSPSSSGGGACGGAGSTTATSQAGTWTYGTDVGADTLASSGLSSTTRASTRLSGNGAVQGGAGVEAVAGVARGVAAAGGAAADLGGARGIAAGGALPGQAPLARGAGGREGLRLDSGAAPGPAMPSAGTLRRALARAARLLLFALCRGCPHLTSLLLTVAEQIARPVAVVSLPSRSGSAALVAAAAGRAGPASTPAAGAAVHAVLSAAGIEPQALLPFAILSGSPGTVDALAGFAGRVLGQPLRLDLGAGPGGMSLLHLAAVMDDDGSMACHLLSSQPWAAWSWLALEWAPPDLSGAAATAAAAGQSDGATGECKAVEGKVAEEAEDRGSGVEVKKLTRLTPGSLSLALGHSAPLERAVAELVLRDDDLVAVQVEEEEQPPAEEQRSVAPHGEAAVEAALANVVEAWGRLSSALMTALCAQLAAQRL